MDEDEDLEDELDSELDFDDEYNPFGDYGEITDFEDTGDGYE